MVPKENNQTNITSSQSKSSDFTQGHAYFF